MEQSKLEEIVADTILVHRQNFEGYKEKWLELISLYENKVREGSITSKTDTRVTLGGGYALVENYIARLLNRSPKYKYLGRESNDSQSADLYQEFSEWQFTEAGCEQELEEVARWAGVCGLAGWKMGWKEEKEIMLKDGLSVAGLKISNPIIMELAKKLGKGANTKVEEEVVNSNYTFTAIPPYKLIWNSDATSMKGVRIFGHEEERFIKDLKEEGYDTTNLEISIKSDTNYWDEQLKDQEQGTVESQVMDMQKVNVAEMYVRYLDNGVWKNSMMTMASLESGLPVSIQFNERPFDKSFIPMGIFTPVSRVGKFPGFGIIEPVQGVLEAEEDSFNIALTALWTDVSRPMEYNPDNILDVEGIEYGARKLTAVRRLGDSVRVMETPTPNINGTSVMEQYLQRAKQNVTGITDFQTGADQLAGGKTLGEIRIKTAESNARLQKIVRNFELQVLEPMGKYALYMNKQFLSKNGKIVYRILGKKGALLEKAIRSKDIEAVKDVVVVSGSTALASQQEEISKWTAVLNQVYMEERSANPTPINKEPIWERIFSAGLMQKDLETFLPNAKELEEKEVSGMSANMKDAKEENANPIIARVLPTDIPSVHIPLHQAEIKVREREVQQTQDPRKIEELQMLVQHLNSHTSQSGGTNPAYTEGMQVGQGIQPQQPTQPMQPTQ